MYCVLMCVRLVPFQSTLQRTPIRLALIYISMKQKAPTNVGECLVSEVTIY